MELDLALALALPNHDGEEEEEEVQSNALSLLLWTEGHPDDHASAKEMKKNVEVEDDEEAAGWPPIKPMRLHRPPRKSKFVKVKMEGVPIGRKIDLSRYHSYHSLTHAFIAMFAKYIRNGDDEDCRILYQDKEGDWLLAGDVPWEIFVVSAERVKIVRN